MIAHLFVAALLSSPPSSAAAAQGQAPCQIWLRIPTELMLVKIEGVILLSTGAHQRVEVRRWPDGHQSASPPTPLWYRVDKVDSSWVLTTRDLEHGELISYAIARTGQAVEDDIGSEIAFHALAACHDAAQAQPAPTVVPPPPVAIDSAPAQPALPSAPAPRPAPHGPRPGTGLLATSLSFGFIGMALGIGGFAYAYEQEMKRVAFSQDCRDYSVIEDPSLAYSVCHGHPLYIKYTKHTLLGTGIGSVGAGMLGLGLILAVPTAIKLRRAEQRGWAGTMRVSGWAGRTGAGLSLGLRF